MLFRQSFPRSKRRSGVLRRARFPSIHSLASGERRTCSKRVSLYSSHDLSDFERPHLRLSSIVETLRMLNQSERGPLVDQLDKPSFLKFRLDPLFILCSTIDD